MINGKDQEIITINKTGNSILNNAKYSADNTDEWYTTYETILEPLLGTSLKFIQNPNLSILSFTKPNEDYLMREIMRYVGNASSAETIRISPEVFQFTTDERKQFVKGFADVTGYIRKSNYADRKSVV